MKVAKDVMAHPASDRGISRALMMREYLRVPELTTPATNWKTNGRKCETILDPHRLSHTCVKLVREDRRRLGWILTNFDPCEEPDDWHAANLCVRSSGGSDDDGNGNAEGQRRDVDKVAGDDAEVEDFVVDPTHAIESILFAIVADLCIVYVPPGSSSGDVAWRLARSGLCEAEAV
jgi:hypothetical protein